MLQTTLAPDAKQQLRDALAKAAEYGGEIIEASDVGVALFVRDPDGQLVELLPASYRDRLPPKP